MGRGIGSKRRVEDDDGENMPGRKKKEEEEEEDDDGEEEYEVDVVRDRIGSSRGSRLALFGSDLRLGRFRPRRRRVAPVDGDDGIFQDFVIDPDNKYAPPTPSSHIHPIHSLAMDCLRSPPGSRF